MRGEEETVFLDDIPGELADPERDYNSIDSISDNRSQIATFSTTEHTRMKFPGQRLKKKVRSVVESTPD